MHDHETRCECDVYRSTGQYPPDCAAPERCDDERPAHAGCPFWLRGIELRRAAEDRWLFPSVDED